MRVSPDDVLGMTFFARVVEARSFSEAARVLEISKSAVSTRIARLEKRFGVRLLHRTTRKVALTADGVRFYERCARVVAEAEHAAEVVAGASAIPRGTLRVFAPAGFGEAYLAEPVGDFVKKYPGVRVELRLSDRVPDLTIDDFDVALVVAGRLTDSGMTTKKLATTRVVVCAAPEYLRRKGIPFRPQDLVLHDCMAHAIRQTVEDWRFHTDEGSISTAALAKLSVDSAPFLRKAALAGVGVVMLPDFVVAKDLAAGRLFRVLAEYPTIDIAIHILHPHDRLPPASVRAFIEHLTVAFRRPSWNAPASPAAVGVGARSSPRKSGGVKGSRASKDVFHVSDVDARQLEAVIALYEEPMASAATLLREKLKGSRVVAAKDVPNKTVTLSTHVRLRGDDGSEREVSLVHPWDDVGRDRVSILDPLGTALLGAAVGSRVSVKGLGAATIVAIPYRDETGGPASER